MSFCIYETTQSFHESDKIHCKLSIRDPQIDNHICTSCAGVKCFLSQHIFTEQGGEILKCCKYQYSYFDMTDLGINDIVNANLSAL